MENSDIFQPEETFKFWGVCELNFRGFLQKFPAQSISLLPENETCKTSLTIFFIFFQKYNTKIQWHYCHKLITLFQLRHALLLQNKEIHVKPVFCNSSWTKTANTIFLLKKNLKKIPFVKHTPTCDINVRLDHQSQARSQVLEKAWEHLPYVLSVQSGEKH